MELIKDYGFMIYYHPRKANVVENALRRKSVQTLRALNAQLSLTDGGEIMAELIGRPDLLIQVFDA